MPVLKNHKHELFAQSLAKGETARKAYCDAGYEDNRKNAWRLKTNKDVAARVQEIQAAGAKSAEVSVQSLIAELEDARTKATSLGQLSAAVRASAEKAKVSGLLVQKIEISEPDFDDRTEVAEILRHVATKRGPESATLLAMIFEHEAELPADFLAKHKPAVLKKLQFIHGLAEEAAIAVPASTTPQLGRSQYAAEQAKPRRMR